MIGILAMAALSIDVVTLYLARLEAQRSADAGALAAARVISISGITSDPNNRSGDWPQVCGAASTVAQAVASQNTVGGAAANTVTVSYLYNGAPADCTAPAPDFAVNPQVQVQVQRTSLPTFFGRIWSAPTNTVTATATAEAYNPSGSTAVVGSVVPVQPRCVKPLIVPNFDPWNPPGATACSLGTCLPFVNPGSGSIVNGGISLTPGPASGVIGENIKLFNDCYSAAAPCPFSPSPQLDIPPQPNVGAFHTYDGNPGPPSPRSLEYVPGQVPSTSAAYTAVPTCGDGSDFQRAVAGCDQTTVYQCGVQAGPGTGNTVDLSNNPGGSGGDTAVATQCLIHQGLKGAGQPDPDFLDTTAYPFRIKAGTGNPITGVRGEFVTSSSSVVSLPIYDSTAGLAFTGNTAPVTIVGFLQVFINYVDTDGSLNVTVLNVAGCGNGTTTPGNPVFGSSPVPVRLITSP